MDGCDNKQRITTVRSQSPVVLRQQAYLIKEDDLNVTEVFNGEWLRMVSVLQNNGEKNLDNIMIGIALEEGFKVETLSIKVYLQSDLLKSCLEYKVLDRWEDTFYGNTLKQGVRVQLKSSIEAGQEVRLIFDVQVDNQKADGVQHYKGMAQFINHKGEKIGIETPVQALQVSTPRLEIVSISYPEVLTKGKEVYYTFCIHNTGNEDFEQVLLKNESLQSLLQKGYIILDKVYGIRRDNKKIGEQLPLEIGELKVNEYTYITMSISMGTLRDKVEIVNEAEVITAPIYRHRQNVPACYNAVRTFATSNRVITPVENLENPIAALEIISKSVDYCVTLESIVTYLFIISNKGNCELSHMMIQDTLPISMVFIPHSVTVDGQKVSGNPITGLSLKESLPVGGSRVITFQARIESKEKSGKYENQGLALFEYAQGDQWIKGEQHSNKTTLLLAKLIIKRTNANPQVNVGEKIEYGIEVLNDGEVMLSQVQLQEEVDEYLIVDEETIQVGERRLKGKLKCLELPDLKPGQSVKITYRAQVKEGGAGHLLINKGRSKALTPDMKIITSESVTEISKVSSQVNALFAMQTVNQMIAMPTDILSYQLILYNPTETEYSEMVLEEVLDEALQFISSTLTINDVLVEGDVKKLPLPTLLPGETLKVCFTAQIRGDIKTQQVRSQASIKYTFQQGMTDKLLVNETITAIKDISLYFCMPITIQPGERHEGIKEIISVGAEIIQIQPSNEQQKIERQLTYRLVLNYRTQTGKCRCYITTQKVNILESDDKEYHHIILWVQEAKVINARTIKGKLYIRAYF